MRLIFLLRPPTPILFHFFNFALWPRCFFHTILIFLIFGRFHFSKTGHLCILTFEMDNNSRYKPKFMRAFLYTFPWKISICVLVFAVWPKIQYPIAFLGVRSQRCTISINSKHRAIFSDTFHDVWPIYFCYFNRFWSWYWNSYRFKMLWIRWQEFQYQDHKRRWYVRLSE